MIIKGEMKRNEEIRFKVELLTSCAGMPRASRIFLSQNCNISSVSSTFNYNTGKINNKFINNFSIISIQWYSYRRVQKRKPRIVVYGLVTRYGPQSSCLPSATG